MVWIIEDKLLIIERQSIVYHLDDGHETADWNLVKLRIAISGSSRQESLRR